jgi:protein-L-isoaspartate(D-aspartate) O-methyltransferase
MTEVADFATDSAVLRRRMVDCQLRTFSITDESVLNAVQNTPREIFVDAGQRSIAYSDAPVCSSAGLVRRPLLMPMVLARLLQSAEVKAGDRFLDVAGGSGYSAAVAAHLAGSVVALESEAGFAEQLRSHAGSLGLAQVETVTGPLSAGAPGKGPFNVILVNGAVEEGLDALFGQLADGGRLMTILRSPGQTGLALKAVRYEKVGADIGMRVVFDANAQILQQFSRKPAFVF